MKKLMLVVSITSLLVACSDNKQNQNYQHPYPQQPSPAYIQQPIVQPQVVAPAPVIVNQQQDNTMMNMATGALLGHVISNAMTNNDRPVERVVERKTVIIDNRQQNVPIQQVANPTVQTVAPVQPIPVVNPKTSEMDMNKLSQSASYKPPSNLPVVASVTPVKSGMDMTKLSSTSNPTVSLNKKSSMDMNKLSKK